MVFGEHALQGRPPVVAVFALGLRFGCPLEARGQGQSRMLLVGSTARSTRHALTITNPGPRDHVEVLLTQARHLGFLGHAGMVRARR